jgi:hypothetical protein
MNVTTTDLVTRAREAINKCQDIAGEFAELDDRLSAGLPLPDQWRTSPRDSVERWVLDPTAYPGRKAILQPAAGGLVDVKLTNWQISYLPQVFTAQTPEEAYRLAAEYLAQSG